MKSITIPYSYENQFLTALQRANLTAIKHKSGQKNINYYQIQMPYSQHDLFMLGIYFNQLVTGLAQ